MAHMTTVDKPFAQINVLRLNFLFLQSNHKLKQKKLKEYFPTLQNNKKIKKKKYLKLQLTISIQIYC